MFDFTAAFPFINFKCLVFRTLNNKSIETNNLGVLTFKNAFDILPTSSVLNKLFCHFVNEVHILFFEGKNIFLRSLNNQNQSIFTLLLLGLLKQYNDVDTWPRAYFLSVFLAPYDIRVFREPTSRLFSNSIWPPTGREHGQFVPRIQFY